MRERERATYVFSLVFGLVERMEFGIIRKAGRYNDRNQFEVVLQDKGGGSVFILYIQHFISIRYLQKFPNMQSTI